MTGVTPYIHAVYCDDVRNEVGGTVSLIGCHGSRVPLDEFPAVLPRMSVVAWIVFPASAPPSQLTAKLFLDEEALTEQPVDLGEPPRLPNEDVGEDTRITGRLILNITPLEIQTPSTLQVCAYLDDQVLRGPPLRFTQKPPPAADPA